MVSASRRTLRSLARYEKLPPFFYLTRNPRIFIFGHIFRGAAAPLSYGGFHPFRLVPIPNQWSKIKDDVKFFSLFSYFSRMFSCKKNPKISMFYMPTLLIVCQQYEQCQSLAFTKTASMSSFILHINFLPKSCVNKRQLLPVTFDRINNDALFDCSSSEYIRMIDLCEVNSLLLKQTMGTALEDLSVELFYEIFTYFQLHEIFNIFSNLNLRMTSIIENLPSISVYLGSSGMNIEVTNNFYYEYLSQINLSTRLTSLCVSDTSSIGNSLWFAEHGSTFLNLRHLSLIDVRRSSLEIILDSLSPIHSLSIFSVHFVSADHRVACTFADVPQGAYHEVVYFLVDTTSIWFRVLFFFNVLSLLCLFKAIYRTYNHSHFDTACPIFYRIYLNISHN